MTRQVGEKALVTCFYEAIENRGITGNEISLTVKEQETAAGSLIRSQNKTEQGVTVDDWAVFLNCHGRKVFMRSWMIPASSKRSALLKARFILARTLRSIAASEQGCLTAFAASSESSR